MIEQHGRSLREELSAVRASRICLEVGPALMRQLVREMDDALGESLADHCIAKLRAPLARPSRIVPDDMELPERPEVLVGLIYAGTNRARVICAGAPNDSADDVRILATARLIDRWTERVGKGLADVAAQLEIAQIVIMPLSEATKSHGRALARYFAEVVTLE